MKMKLLTLNKTIIIVTCFLLLNFKFIKQSNHSVKQQHQEFILKDTLFDKYNGNIYVLDKKRIFITAYDKNGKVIWRTDPVKDAFIRKYRTDRPIIVSFEFGTESVNQKSEAIWIRYNNSQFGYLLKKNGKFRCQGQD